MGPDFVIAFLGTLAFFWLADRVINDVLDSCEAEAAQAENGKAS